MRIELIFPLHHESHPGGSTPQRIFFKEDTPDLTVVLALRLASKVFSYPLGVHKDVVRCLHRHNRVLDDIKPARIVIKGHLEKIDQAYLGALFTAGWQKDLGGLAHHELVVAET